jgi:N-acetyl-anhydromuramyl-L-alanine amidase AmpD
VRRAAFSTHHRLAQEVSVASVIRPNRTEVNRTFPYLGFTIRTGRPASFEVALASSPHLFESAARAQRTSENFASTHSAGPLPAPSGEAVWIVPSEMLARFAGKTPQLYYALATFPGGDTAHPEIVAMTGAAAPAISLSRSYTGTTRRLAGVGAGRGAASGPSYSQADPHALEWAGDAIAAGTMQPVSAPAEGKAFAYSDGLGPLPVEDGGGGIEGAIPDLEDEATAAAQAVRVLSNTPDDPFASRFVPADPGNFASGPGTARIARVVIHITDSRKPSIAGPISWFQNPSAKVSAHYVIGQDGEIVQMVHHGDVAWHAHAANRDSIGIEHVANTSGMVPTEAQLCASAALVNWLCATYGIPIDRTHVLGHAEADPTTTHTGCPNAVWDWPYFMGMVTSGSCYPRPAAQALGASFDVRWEGVAPVAQPTDATCWAAAAAMVVGWRERMSIDPRQFRAGRIETYDNGLSPREVDELAASLGLVAEPPQDYAVEGFRALLEQRGPLWVARAVPDAHAVCVYGLSGDGGPDTTFVHYHDPMPIGQGSAAQTRTYRQFMLEFDRFASDDHGRVNNQIMHAGGTGGRSASAVAQGARGLAVVEVGSAIAGAVMTRILDNDGDVHWELDQLNGLKKPWNNDAYAGPPSYGTKTLRLTGPRGSTVFGADEIWVDCELTFQYNGRSVGNVAVTVTGTGDAAGLGLTLKEQIADEANSFTAAGSPDAFAAVKVRLHYRFDSPIYDDMIAISDLVLYGNGTYAFTTRWTQT